MKDYFLRHFIAIGLTDKTLQERLVRDNNFDFEKRIEIWHTLEVTCSQAKTSESSNSSHNIDIDYVS